MITKVCQFKARREDGEQLVHIFQPGNQKSIDRALEKVAAPILPEVQRFIDKLQTDHRKIYVLVNALGAGEYWSSNINGDYFPEEALIHEGGYGYKTFYNAHPYKHHVNKDPSKSFGDVVLAVWHPDMKRVELIIAIDRARAKQFGAQDVVDKLDSGLFPDVSMGCRVPYDLCSICLDKKKYRQAQATYKPGVHRSVGQAVLAFHKKNPIRGLSITRNDYCVHLRTQLNRILPDGRKVYAINDYPRFFDISFVFIGADKTAKVMMKLAEVDPRYGDNVVPSWLVAESLGYCEQPATEKSFDMEKAASPNFLKKVKVKAFTKGVSTAGAKIRSAIAPATPQNAPTAANALSIYQGAQTVRDKLNEKNASQGKAAEITKRVTPQFGGKTMPLDREKDLPNEVLDQLGKGDLGDALSTSGCMGIMLRPREFQRITIIQLGAKPLADKLDQEGKVFSPSSDTDTSVPMGTDRFSEAIKRILLPLVEGRSFLDPVAKRRAVRIMIKQAMPEDRLRPTHVENDGLLEKVSAAYNGYLDRVAGCMMDADEVIGTHADLWEAVHGEGVGEGMSKIGAGVHPGVVIGGVGAGLLLSTWAAWQQRRAMMGDRAPTGAIIDTIAQYPKLMMAIGGLGALHQQKSEIPAKLIRAVGKAGKELIG